MVDTKTRKVRDYSRVIIVDSNKKILFIHRNKYGEEYFLPPGGATESGETAQQAAIRETKEETNLDVILDKELFTIPSVYRGEDLIGHFFLITKFSGEVKLIGPELEYINSENTFEHVWLSIDELDGKTIYPEGLKELLKKEFS